jgi:hypothetical protein
MAVDRREWPLWVSIALWGLSTRASAWLFFWLSILIAAGSLAYSLIDARFTLGGLLVLAALWYYLAIRWVDRHSSWH